MELFIQGLFEVLVALFDVSLVVDILVIVAGSEVDDLDEVKEEEEDRCLLRLLGDLEECDLFLLGDLE